MEGIELPFLGLDLSGQGGGGLVAITLRVQGNRVAISRIMLPGGHFRDGPPGAFGLLMNRYAHEHDLDLRGLGALAVAQRNGAIKNPNAYTGLKHKITVDDYINSRQVSSPLRLLDSVMWCDGGNGLIMMKTSRAKRLGFTNLIYPVSYAEVSNFDCANQTPDMTRTGHSVVGPEADRKSVV